jgi:hypothetical protein
VRRHPRCPVVLLLALFGCVLPPVEESDEPVDSASDDEVERDPPPPDTGTDCALVISMICSDCDVTVDWSGSSHLPKDPSHPDFVAVWSYDKIAAPTDLAQALCQDLAYDRPDRLSIRDDYTGLSAVLGEDLPRLTNVGILEVGYGYTYLQALLIPNPGSTNDVVAFE